jgi:hypothetical protein
MRFAIAAILVLSACGGDDGEGEAFPTFQECFDDHHVAESLSVNNSIVVCCLDHPIGGASMVCGADAAACKAYLGTNLSTTSATTTEVDAACADYVTQKGM